MHGVQEVQALAPALLEKVPDGQGVGDEEPWAQNAPAGQVITD